MNRSCCKEYVIFYIFWRRGQCYNGIQLHQWWNHLHDITSIGCCCRTCACVSEYCAPYHYDCSTQWLDWVDGWIRERSKCVGCCNAHQYRNKLAYCSKPMFHCPVCRRQWQLSPNASRMSSHTTPIKQRMEHTP